MAEASLFRIVLDDLDILVLVQIDDLILRDANERMRRKVLGIADEDALETVAQGDGRAEEHMLDVVEERHADSRIELAEHVLGNLRDGTERRLLHITFALRRDVVVDVRDGDDARILMDVLARESRWEARSVHALVMLQRGETHALGNVLVGTEDIEAVACMIAVCFEVFALERLDVLFQEALRKLRLADVVHEARHDDVMRLLLRNAHPLGDDAREDGNAQRMIVDVARKVVEFIQIVDGAALLRHGREISLHHRRRALDGHLVVLGDGAEDVLRFRDDFLIFSDESMAARQRLTDDRRRRQFEVVLDIDGRYIQES